MTMQIELNTKRGEYIIRHDNGQSVDVREFYEGCAWTGHLKDGETAISEDGCTATRRGELVIWTEPTKAELKAYRERVKAAA